MTQSDPDRFHDYRTPGSQEWWYFDAISDDGGLALVVVWYAGLPFDPAYGLAVKRHLNAPARHPAPDPFDHSAVGLSLYRDGKTIAYALNRYPADRFAHRPEPFSVGVAKSRFDRDASGYSLHVETPARDGRPLVADLRFTPAPGTEPLEREIGGRGGPHRWILAAPDCRVEGKVGLGGPKGFSIDFQGRGYHDHNAGAEELSMAWTRWRWGRVHLGRTTSVYYQAEPRDGPLRSLWVVLDDGRPVEVRDDAELTFAEWRRHPLGLRYARSLAVEGADPPARWRHRHLVDYGPFYLRWLTDFNLGDETAIGFAELLEAKNLHNPWFNWMIPYRLKRPDR